MDTSAITSRVAGIASQLERGQAELPDKASGASFKDVLAKVVSDVDGLQKQAEGSVQDFAAGKVENVHEVMIAMEKAELSFKFMMEARNKLVDAYRDVMRMQV